MKTITRFAILGIALALLLGCANKSYVRYEKVSEVATKQDHLATIRMIRKNQKLYGDKNAFLYHMDIGTLYHYSHLYDSSNIALEKSLKIYDDLFTRSVSNEALSILTNDNLRPYRSAPYEVSLVHFYKLVNYLAQGDVEAALVETRRAQLLFDEWEKKSDKNEFYGDGLFHYASYLAYSAAGETDNALISLYKSIEAYRQSVTRVPRGLEQDAYYAFQHGGRPEDIERLKLPEPQSADPSSTVPSSGETEIVLIGHAGRGPLLGESVWWGSYVRGGALVVHHRSDQGDTATVALPAPALPAKEYEKASKGRKTQLGTTFHIKFAMPKLITIPSKSQYFTLEGDGGRPVQSRTMTNTDLLLEQHLNNTKTATLMRTVVRVVLRTIASQKTKSAMNTGNPLANLLLNVGTDVLADQMEKADLRSCFLVPKEVHVVRMPVKPGTHRVKAKVHNRAGQVIDVKDFGEVQVEAGRKKVLVYSSLI